MVMLNLGVADVLHHELTVDHMTYCGVEGRLEDGKGSIESIGRRTRFKLPRGLDLQLSLHLVPVRG
jgi:hypothetical protein